MIENLEQRDDAQAALPSDKDAAMEQFNLGSQMVRHNRMPAAIEALTQATILSPNNPFYHKKLANIFYILHRFKEAASQLRHVVDLSPQDLQSNINLGASLHKAGKLQEAVVAYSQALQLNPNSAMAWTNLGIAVQDLGDLDLAIAMHRKAIALAPDMPSAYNNLGSALSKQGTMAEALSCYRHVLTLDPNHAGAYFNIGYISEMNCDLTLAEKYYQIALSCKPKSSTLRFYIAELNLLRGNFRKGWEGFEYRWESWQMREHKRNCPQPQWRGEALNGETILLYAEQGLGDTMQFVRYAPLVAERGGRVLLEVQPRVQRLLEGMAGVEHVFAQGDAIPEFQWQCPLMSLPLAFGTELGTVPHDVPYLHAKENEEAAWAQRLQGREFRVGLVWAGNRMHVREKMRSIPLAAFEPLTRISGTRFYSLQKGRAAAQIKELSSDMQIVDLDAEQKDFADTAAIAANLDLIISIDTSVAHLAGAIGRPLWVPLYHAPDWRWLTEREDSPWYPKAHLFRKSLHEDWGAVIERMRQELEKLVKQNAGRGVH